MAAGAFLERHGLLTRGDGDVVRLPVLMAGRLMLPPEVSATEVDRALGAESSGELDGAVAVRDGDLRLVLPRIEDPAAIPVADTDRLSRELYALPWSSVETYIDAVGRELAPTGEIMRRARPLLIGGGDLPRALIEPAIGDMAAMASGARMRAAVDRELAFADVPGSRLLDGWVDSDLPPEPGRSAAFSAGIHGETPVPPRGTGAVRAMPTRQLHITAGNSPVVPLVSILRAFATKSAAVLKLPAGALVAGSALAVAMALASPDHPLTRFSSVLYWRGGDPRVEDAVFARGAFDRIVVWGSPDAVESVAARSPFVKTLSFNPRYGASLIGRGALGEPREETVRRAVADALVWNQKACISSLVQYVEGDEAEGRRFAEAVARELARWDDAYPDLPSDQVVAALRRARRGALRAGDWHANGSPRAPSSAAVHMRGAFDLSAHPMSRLIAVRHVPRLEDALGLLHHGVSQVGVLPDERRRELRDRICARGVSCVFPLGEADTIFPAMPHDGMRPMSELVSWVAS
jgi:hypothetical protein